MCTFTTTYHTACKHYSPKQFIYCPLVPQAEEALPINSLPRNCHNTTDLGLETDFSSNKCIKCQRILARATFFGKVAPEPQAITYGVVASRSGDVPSVSVTSWVDTTPTVSATSSVRGGVMARSDSSMSLASDMSLSSIFSSNGSASSQGSYRGWSFKEGKFGNAHWRSYQDDEEAALRLARQKAKEKARSVLMSCQEHY